VRRFHIYHSPRKGAPRGAILAINVRALRCAADSQYDVSHAKVKVRSDRMRHLRYGAKRQPLSADALLMQMCPYVSLCEMILTFMR
jgi:hypothetical protein